MIVTRHLLKTSDIEVTDLGGFGDDLTIVNAARVSFEKESDWNTVLAGGEEVPMLKDGDVKLINYLAKHKHFSPFNHAFLSFRVKAPIFVARQLVKHKFMPWNEVSRRYVDSEPEFFIPPLRKRAENVKQGSSEELASEHYVNMVKVATANSLQEYNLLLKGGVCPEQARMVLPQNTMTEWIWSGTLGAFLDMLVLRLDPHTQYETRIVAQLIHKEVERHFPVSTKARLESI